MNEKDKNSRRDFFRESAKGFGKFFADVFLPDEEDLPGFIQKKEPLPFLRPPGALPEPAFLEACTRCDDCVRVCPVMATRKAGEEYPPYMDNTPIILPQFQPCTMCDAMACMKACETGALQQNLSWSEIRMGIPHLDPERCVTFAGEGCDVCIQKCPISNEAAITLNEFGNPEFDLTVCTGCGVCQFKCPEQAIEVMRA